MKKRTIAVYVSLQGLYWLEAITEIGFMATFLSGIGISNAGVGFVSSLSVFASMFIAWFSGLHIDKGTTSSTKVMMYILLIQIPLLLGAVAFNGKILVAVFFCLFLSAFRAGASIMNKIYADLQKTELRFEFSYARAAGSLTFAIGAFLAGGIIKKYGLTVVPAVGILLTILQGILVTHIKKITVNTEPTNNSPNGWKNKRRNIPREIILFFLGIALIFSAHSSTNIFLKNIVFNLGGNVKILGEVNAFISFVEVPAMLIYPKLKTKYGDKILLETSLLMFLVKMILFATARSVVGIFVAGAFQIISFGLYTPAIMGYLLQSVPGGETATVQTFSVNMVSLGSAVSAVITGKLLDIMPVSNVAFVLVAVSALGVVIGLLAMTRRVTAIIGSDSKE